MTPFTPHCLFSWRARLGRADPLSWEGGRLASAVSVAAAALVAAGALCSLSEARFADSLEWLRFGSFSVRIGFKVDDLAALMLSSSGCRLCVHVFSLGYMRDDSARFAL